VSLKYRVFLHSYLGFNSNSTLFYGERDAILIDAGQLLSDAHKMVAEIIPMRKNLTTSMSRISTPITISGWVSCRTRFPRQDRGSAERCERHSLHLH